MGDVEQEMKVVLSNLIAVANKAYVLLVILRMEDFFFSQLICLALQMIAEFYDRFII